MAHERLFAIVNPAAGGGRCGKLAGRALDRLRSAGVPLEIAWTAGPGHATELSRDARSRGYRRFLAVGGDGTSMEILNGLFPGKADDGGREEDGRPILAFLPLGSGNSFMRDFAPGGMDNSVKRIRAGVSRPCDVLRLTHRDGQVHFINLATLGFPATVARVTNLRLKGWGEMGYVLGILASLAGPLRHTLPLRLDGKGEFDPRPCLFLAFCNTRYTGGRMLLAPDADPADGFIEYVRWDPVGRLGLLWNLPRLLDGSHLRHPSASRASIRRADFKMEEAVPVMVDGESLTLECRSIEVLSRALDVL
ncbi:MAG TPA: diacylglycerol kinase family protein [Candidatus Polarisedimenticolia bacterium]|jgi:YegS/Rv2252/BmrU family lipid kinase|nr:diacylglycerol kinase family protein [Candidatus Polarisedimenticolia bacterium]